MRGEAMTYGVPYQTHSEPSKQAAEAIRERVETLEEGVLNYIKACGDQGATDEEIFASFPRNAKESTLRARRVRLVQLGKVVAAFDHEANCPFTRRTFSGRQAQIWVAA